MRRPLPPDELFPAHSADISQRFVTLATGIRVRVAESGPPDGPPVVMLPGWGAALYMYRHGLDAIARRGMRAIAVDLRGFGLSDRPRSRGAYSLGNYLGDLDALFDALALERPALIGQSMGGGVALRFALREPERISRVVLINPTGLVTLRFLPLLWATPRPVLSMIGARLVPRPVVAMILRRLAYGDASKVTERDIDEYWAPTQLPGYVSAARAALGDFDWSAVTDAEAASLAVPTMVLFGEQDHLIRGSIRSAKRLAGVEVRTLPGGHCVHEENPGPAYELIADFMSLATR